MTKKIMADILDVEPEVLKEVVRQLAQTVCKKRKLPTFWKDGILARLQKKDMELWKKTAWELMQMENELTTQDDGSRVQAAEGEKSSPIRYRIALSEIIFEGS